MKFIQETIHNGIMDALEKQLNKFDEAFTSIQFKHNLAIVEGVTDDLDPDLDTAMDQLAKRLEAARRGLGLTNKLPPGDSRVLHRRKIMGNLNKIRALFNFIQKKLEDSVGTDENIQQPPTQRNFNESKEYKNYVKGLKQKDKERRENPHKDYHDYIADLEDKLKNAKHEIDQIKLKNEIAGAKRDFAARKDK